MYVQLTDLTDQDSLLRLDAHGKANDAVVALVIDASAADIEKIDRTFFAERPHLIVAAAKEHPELDELYLEAAALDELARDERLLETDPLVEREIHELLANALDYLHSRVSLLLDPAAGAIIWFSGTTLHGEHRGFAAGEVLNRIFTERFPKTPTIANEQIVRRKVTPATKSARKRLMLGILERSLVADLGYANSTSADASMFRTVLVHTGLYDQETARWARPGDLVQRDSCLAEVWREIADFYGMASRHPKHFSSLTETLTTPPFGIRDGLIPVLLAAGLRAFGRSLAIRKNIEGKWSYVDDVQPTTIEDIAACPDVFELEVFDLNEAQTSVLKAIISEFSPVRDNVETDLVRTFHDAFLAWQRNLPKAALTDRALGAEAKGVQDLVRVTGNDPVDILFRGLPDIANAAPLDMRSRDYLSLARQQIEGVTEQYIAIAVTTAQQVFSIGYHDDAQDLLSAAMRWASELHPSLLHEPSLDSVSKGIINRVRGTETRRDTDASLARALSAMLVGFDFENWDSVVARRFARELRSRIREIEDTVMTLHGEKMDAAPFIIRRIATYLARLESIVGPEAAAGMLNSIGRS